MDGVFLAKPPVHTSNWYILNSVRLKSFPWSNLTCGIRKIIWFSRPLEGVGSRCISHPPLSSKTAVLWEWTTNRPFKVNRGRQALYSSSFSFTSVESALYTTFTVHYVPIVFFYYFYIILHILFLKNVFLKMCQVNPLSSFLSLSLSFSFEHLYTLTALHFVQKALSVCVWVCLPACVREWVCLRTHGRKHRYIVTHITAPDVQFALLPRLNRGTQEEE